MALAETLKKQLKAAKKEYTAKRRELERALAQLDRDYGFLLAVSTARASGNGRRRRSTRAYGGVKTAVLDAIKSGKGLKPAQIVGKTGLASAQVHNSLTGLKKVKLVKVKDGLYTAA
jgi:hypothetical protein